MGSDTRHYGCRFLSGLVVLFGALGMAISFRYLASASFEDITAGTSGFVAGAIFVGAGVLSLSMLASKARDERDLRATP